MVGPNKTFAGGCPRFQKRTRQRQWQKGSNHGKGSDQMGMDDDARASDLWRAGQYASHITCLTLDWAGNKFFYHECLRRATTPDLPSIGA